MFTTFTKTMHPSDLYFLTPAIVKVVDSEFTRAAEQHPARRWEYAMALELAHQLPRVESILDVGGYGSPLVHMFEALMPGTHYEVVDPRVNSVLHDYVASHRHADLVLSISVIEHVDDVDQFCVDLVEATAPGGTLFITMDCWDRPSSERDAAHFHWMRNQIFCPETWKALQKALKDLGMNRYGDEDWTYYGHQLFGSYTFCSLAMQKGA